jgi:hypothetical protein
MAHLNFASHIPQDCEFPKQTKIIELRFLANMLQLDFATSNSKWKYIHSTPLSITQRFPNQHASILQG